jgi:hypothetical protein
MRIRLIWGNHELGTEMKKWRNLVVAVLRCESIQIPFSEQDEIARVITEVLRSFVCLYK